MASPPLSQTRTGNVARVIGDIRAERLRFVLMRVSFAGVVLILALLTAWALPWVPLGMTAENYTATSALLLLLALLAFVSSMVFVFAWAPLFHREPPQEFLRVIFGAHQLIRGPEQFQSRLAAECRGARRDRRRVFSLIVSRVPQPEATDDPRLGQPEDERHIGALLVRSMVRANDIVAYSQPDEVWVLLLGASAAACQGIARRLADSLSGAANEPLQAFVACGLGTSTYGDDGVDPEELLSTASRRIVPLADCAERDAA